MRPTVVSAARNLETAVLGIPLRIGFHQRDVAVVVAQIKAAIGINDGHRASPQVAAAPFPLDFAGFPIGAKRLARPVPVGVDVIAEDDVAAVAAIEVLLKVDPLFSKARAAGN